MRHRLIPGPMYGRLVLLQGVKDDRTGQLHRHQQTEGEQGGGLVQAGHQGHGHQANEQAGAGGGGQGGAGQGQQQETRGGQAQQGEGGVMACEP